jgi:hypothetical protein
MTADQVNRAHWDALAAVHGQDRCYDLAGLTQGRDSLGVVEWDAVGEVEGLDVLHV